MKKITGLTQILIYLLIANVSLASVESFNLCESVVQTKCPYLGGTAVYKARSLNALYNPGAYYEDIAICNAVGIYKNGKGLFDDENEALETVSGLSAMLADLNQLKLYPNPTEDQLMIEYNNGSILILYDIIGRQVKEINLPSNQTKVLISLHELASGVYTFKQLISGVQSETGKLIKN